MVTIPALCRALLPAAVLAGLLAGCGPRAGYPEVHEQVVMREDFEQPADSLPASRTTEQAHSGRAATVLDATHEYSETYRMRLGNLFATRPRKLRLSAWVWVPRYEDDANLILQISAPDDPNRTVYYKVIYLSDNGPYGKWKRVRQDFDLTGDFNSNSVLAIYAWRAGAAQPIYLDDWELVDIH